MKILRVASLFLVSVVITAGAQFSFAQSALLRVTLDSRSLAVSAADEAYKDFSLRIEKLGTSTFALRQKAGLSRRGTSYVFPAVVRLQQNGKDLPTGGRTRGSEITLDIDPSFNTSFHPNRVAFLQDVYNRSKLFIEALFGDAAISGTVKVVNVDAGGVVNDRRIVVGGYYLPNNGSGGREIRLGDYNSDETMAVSLIHNILLAYLPDPAYGFDAYLEGICRAVTQKIVRTPAALPASLSQDIIENTLENSYEAGAFYDWTNQKALSGSRFIAPNLLNLPIPDGTLGGIFLARYKMSGTVWQKLLAEHPSAAKDLNIALRTNPASATTQTGLENLLVSVLPAGATVEGEPVLSWLKKQYILQLKNVPGVKLLTQMFPFTTDLSSTDYGVFGIEATAFSTQANGDEVLLSGTSYPVYWDEAFNRINAGNADQIDVNASYGSVVPNFPNKGNNIPYRVSVDVPFQDRLSRTYLPAGAVATPASTIVSNFYGTYVGPSIPATSSLLLRVQIGGDTLPDIPIKDGAFGVNVTNPSFLSTRSLVLNVVRKDANLSETTVLTRRVNKGPGVLAVSLGDAPVQNVTFNAALNKGVQMIGIFGNPLSADLSDVLSSGSGLSARYNPARTAYDLYPSFGGVTQGYGYFGRFNSSFTPSYVARLEKNVPTAIALRPGWNQISVPGDFTQSIAGLQVIRAKDFPVSFANASTIVGNTIFQFTPGANDSVTGAPEGGTFSAATSLVPGKGYFIRCLSPEGALILFTPNSDTGGRIVPIPQTRVKLTVSGTQESTTCVVGQSKFASTGFDPALDSGLPPGIGGFQARVESSSEPRYQDFRPYGGLVTYRVVVSGCTVGKRYYFGYSFEQGSAAQVTIRNLAGFGNFLSSLGTSGTFFSATSSEMIFEFTIRSAR